MEVPKRLRPGRSGRDQGAAAVELALILPVLMMILLGIINYGLWFNDSLQLRQGVREVARQAVVQTPFGGTCLPPATTGMNNVACGFKLQNVTSGGVPSVKVFTTTTWDKGNELVVCAMVASTKFTSFVPMPAGGLIKSKTTMSIENSTLPSPASYTDTPGDWSWCS